MELGKGKRVLRLEQRQTATDQKKEYCACRCHWKYIEDYFEISDEKAVRVWKIVESFGSYQLPDGTWKSRAEDLLERIANRPKCTCSCKH